MDKLQKALNLWNKATNPAIPRTDHGHKATAKAARKVMAFIRKHYVFNVHYYERSNGSLAIK